MSLGTPRKLRFKKLGKRNITQTYCISKTVSMIFCFQVVLDYLWDIKSPLRKPQMPNFLDPFPSYFSSVCRKEMKLCSFDLEQSRRQLRIRKVENSKRVLFLAT